MNGKNASRWPLSMRDRASSSILGTPAQCCEAHGDAAEELPRALRRPGSPWTTGDTGTSSVRPRIPHRPSPRAPHRRPRLQKVESPRDTLHPALTSPFRSPRTPPGAHFLTHAHSDHLVGLKNDWRSRPARRSTAPPSPRRSQVPETAGRPNLDRDPRHGPTHRGGPRGHRRTPHGDRDRRRALSGQRRLPLRGNVRANLPHRRLQARGLVRRRGRREERKHPRVPHEGATGPAAAGQHLLQPRAPFSEPSRRAGRRRVADRGQVSRQEVVLGLDRWARNSRRRPGRDGPTGSMHQGTLRRGEGGARRVARADETVPAEETDDDDGIRSPDLEYAGDGPARGSSTTYSAAPLDGTMAFDARQGSRVGVPEAASDPRHAHRPRGEQRTESVGDTADGVGGHGAAGLPSTPAGEDAAGGVSADDDDDDDEPAVIRAVPYSLHAPYEELRAIVRALAPVAVVGNTKPPRSPGAAVDPEAFFSRLLSDPRTSEDEEDGDEEEDGDDSGFLDGKRTTETDTGSCACSTRARSRRRRRPRGRRRRPEASRLSRRGGVALASRVDARGENPRDLVAPGPPFDLPHRETTPTTTTTKGRRMRMRRRAPRRASRPPPRGIRPAARWTRRSTRPRRRASATIPGWTRPDEARTRLDSWSGGARWRSRARSSTETEKARGRDVGRDVGRMRRATGTTASTR